MQISVWYPDTKALADALSPLRRRRGSSRTQQAQGIRMKLRPVIFMHKTWRDEDAGMAGPRQLPTAFSPLPGASPGAAAGLPGWEKGVLGGSGDGHCLEPWTWPHAYSGCGRGSVDAGPGDGGSAVSVASDPSSHPSLLCPMGRLWERAAWKCSFLMDSCFFTFLTEC